MDAAIDALIKLGDAAVPKLVQALEDQDPIVRQCAAITLGHIGNREAIPALQNAQQDTDKRVRRQAAEALRRIEG